MNLEPLLHAPYFVYSLKGTEWVVVSGIAVIIIGSEGGVVSAVGIPGRRVFPAQIVSIA